MKNILKLQVLFTTVIDSSQSIVVYKIPNADLIEALKNTGLQNSVLDYAIAYIDTFPTFDPSEISKVEWVRVQAIETKIVDREDKHNVKIEVIEELEPDSFEVEFGLDTKADIEVPKYVVLKNVNIN